MSEKPHDTPVQGEAIAVEGKSILLSAAAGSGKTYTLTKRIVNRVREGKCDLSRIVVVTYTTAAAEELRGRISAKIAEAIEEEPDNGFLRKQLIAVPTAQISTVHSFCLHILRENAQKCNLDANFRVGGQAEIAVLRREAMRDTLEKFYGATSENPECDYAIDLLTSTKDEEKLGKSLLGLYEKLLGMRDGMNAILLPPWTGNFFDTPYGDAFFAVFSRFVDFYHKEISAICDPLKANGKNTEKHYYSSLSNDRDLLSALKEALDSRNFNALCAIVNNAEKKKLANIGNEKNGLTDRAKTLHGEFWARLGNFQTAFFGTTDAAIASSYEKTAFLSRGIAKILNAFADEFKARKQRVGVVDFSDLEQETLALLYREDGTLSETALTLRNRYDEIYVDEYQDTNEVQDRIFCAVAKANNRFFVGDIKQSIFRFRRAEPEIFASYRKRFPTHKPGEMYGMGDGFSLFMSENFRCDRPVISFTNMISDHTFGVSGSIPYDPADALVFAKRKPEDEAKITCAPVRVVLIEKSSEDANPIAEAEFVAKTIRDMIEHETKDDGTPFTYKDFAILLRDYKNTREKYVNALTKAGIPTRGVTEGNFYQLPEILLVLCLLNVIDNPLRDVYLAGALRSPVFDFTMDDLIRVRRHVKEGFLYDALCTYPPNGDALSAKISYFTKTLAHWRKEAKERGADRILRLVFDETGLLACADGDCERNLLTLYDLARGFEANGYRGLYAFLSYLESLAEEGGDKTETSNAQDGNAVSLMTVHASKGLEYPVCFLAETAHTFNRKDREQEVLYDAHVGIGAKLRVDGGIVPFDTVLREAVAFHMADESVAEEMRLLYVALTRARERLIVSGMVANVEKREQEAAAIREIESAETAYAANSYLGWIMTAVSGLPTVNDCFRYETISDQINPPVCSLPEADDTEADQTAVKTYAAAFSYDYIYKYEAEVPTKLTVSKLYPGILDEDGDKPMDDDALTLDEYPAFMRTDRGVAKATDRGTATHVFLQFCDFERFAQEGAAAEREHLVKEQFLSPEIGDLVNLDELERFRSSDLFSAMRSSQSLRREFRFNLNLPAKELSMEKERQKALENEFVTVQGVMDCCFIDENGELILVDYKTDRLSDAEMHDKTLAEKKLRERHAKQLSYYRRACEMIFEKPVKRTLVYSLMLGDVVDIFPS